MDFSFPFNYQNENEGCKVSFNSLLIIDFIRFSLYFSFNFMAIIIVTVCLFILCIAGTNAQSDMKSAYGVSLQIEIIII